MIYIDDLKIELLMPEILIEYLANNNIHNVFDIINNNYYLNNKSNEFIKNIILNACLSLLSNEINDCVSEDEILLSEYQKVCSGIQYIDTKSNDKIKEKLKALIEFKDKVKNYNFNDRTVIY